MRKPGGGKKNEEKTQSSVISLNLANGRSRGCPRITKKGPLVSLSRKEKQEEKRTKGETKYFRNLSKQRGRKGGKYGRGIPGQRE